MRQNSKALPQSRTAVLTAALLALSACTTGLETTSGGLSSDLSCVDDTRACIEARQRALAVLTRDPGGGWVQTPPSPRVYASGVRLFAMKKTKATLTCENLKRARAEAARAEPLLKGQEADTLTPAQISRATMLADEVARELAREQSRRCR